MRTSSLKLVVALLTLVLVTSCASYTATTTTPPSSRTPYEQANLNFAAAAADYKVALQVVKDLRKAKLVNDDLWSEVVEADGIVKEWAPIVHELLELWGRYGERPSMYGEAFDHLTSAHLTVHDVKRAAIKTAAGGDQ